MTRLTRDRALRLISQRYSPWPCWRETGRWGWYPRGTHHDQVDERQGVEVDIPEVHHSHDVDDDHDNRDAHDQRRHEVEPEQNKRHYKDGRHTDPDVLDRHLHDRQVLLVEHVEHAETQEEQGHKVMSLDFNNRYYVYNTFDQTKAVSLRNDLNVYYNEKSISLIILFCQNLCKMILSDI